MKTFYKIIVSFIFLFGRLSSQNCSGICNGDFDNTFLTGGVSLLQTIPCWSTTATDSLMEAWNTGFNGVPSYSGNQFVELNATQAATMYQDFNVVAGSPISIGFAHRGRAGVDTVEVSIGPVGGPYTSLGRWGDGTAAWGYHTATYTPPTSGQYEIRFTPVYWSGGNNAIGNFLDAISVSTPLTLSISATPATVCAGASSTLTVMGATNYTWSTLSTQSTIVVSPNITTSYSVTAISGACTGTAIITVTVMPSPLLTVAGPTAICIGNSAALTAGGAQNYTWVPGNINTSLIVVTPTVTTTYSVIGSNGINACKSNTTHMVIVNPTPTVTLPQPSYSVCPGSVTSIMANGANSYTWAPSGTVGNPYAASPLTNVVYTVTGASAAGCTAAATCSFTLLPLPVLSFTSAGISCGSLGTATVAFSGGVGPFSSTWMPTSQQGSTAINLSPGTYVVNVFDNGTGCTTSSASTFTSTVPFTGNLNTASLSCNSVNTGSASFTNISGGSVAQNFFWTNGITVYNTPTVSTLSAGTWSLTVTDALTGCQIYTVFTISQPPPLALNVTLSPATACVGSTVTLMAVTSGGTPSYNYTWTTGPTTSNYTVTQNNVGTGNYTVTSSDANNCIISKITPLSFINNPVLAVSNATICPSGTGTLTASGAATYTWSNNSYGNTMTANPLTDTQYTVTGTALGCTTVATATIFLKSAPIPIATSNGPLCANRALVLDAQGGSSYLWTGPSGFNAIIQSPTLNPVTLARAGIYSLTATGANGCHGSTTVAVAVYNLPDGQFDADQLKGCAPFCSNFDFIVSPGSAQISAMSWSVNGQSFTGNTFQTCFQKPGDYAIAGTLSDINNCVNTETILVHAYPRPQADFIFSPERPIEGLDEVTFKDNSKYKPLKEWNWYFINNDGYQASGETVLYTFQNAGTYPVAMVVANTWGCTDTVVKAITVEPDFSFYIPNAFTPNGDLTNQIFRPVGIGIKEIKLDVYDRWGEHIFSTTKPGDGWDGTYRGQPCKEDTYIWKLYVKSANSSPNQRERWLVGHVTLLR